MWVFLIVINDLLIVNPQDMELLIEKRTQALIQEHKSLK